jgi:hypothetical protein
MFIQLNIIQQSKQWIPVISNSMDVVFIRIFWEEDVKVGSDVKIFLGNELVRENGEGAQEWWKSHRTTCKWNKKEMQVRRKWARPLLVTWVWPQAYISYHRNPVSQQWDCPRPSAALSHWLRSSERFGLGATLQWGQRAEVSVTLQWT